MKSFVNVKDVGTSYRALNNSFIINLAAGKAREKFLSCGMR